jgi:hypothetical protein
MIQLHIPSSVLNLSGTKISGTCVQILTAHNSFLFVSQCKYFWHFLPVLFYKYCCPGDIVTFTKVLTIYHSWIHPPPFSFILPPPIPGIVSAQLIFHFHSWVHNILPYSPHSPFPYVLPLPLVPTPRQDLFYHPVLHFYFKKWNFCLFETAIRGVSLWHFYLFLFISIYYILYIVFNIYYIIYYILYYTLYIIL